MIAAKKTAQVSVDTTFESPMLPLKRLAIDERMITMIAKIDV